jgi:hypothetical protein
VSDVRVPRGVYRDAACELTEEDGQLDKYTLARRVGDKLGRYVSSAPASAWVRRQSRGYRTAAGWSGGMLRRVGAATNGSISAGGRPASYAVVEVELLDWRKARENNGDGPS